jgi:hypothetical protein
MPKHKSNTSFSKEDVIVLGILELFAIPLCQASWHAIVTDQQYIRGIIGLLVGLPTGIAGFTFHWWKDKALRRSTRQQIIRWWPIAILLAFGYVAGPNIYERAMKLTEAPPVEAPKQTVSTPIITSVKIQFNAAGTVPREIESKNIKWVSIAPDEPNPKYGVRTSIFPNILPNILPNIFDSNSNCPPFGFVSNPDCPKPTVKTLVLFLSFDTPIHFKTIVLDTNAAKLPKWDKISMNEKFVILWFHGEVTNTILQIRVTD